MKSGTVQNQSLYFGASIFLDMLYEKLVESSFAEKITLANRLQLRFDEEYDTHGNRAAVMLYKEIALLPQARGRKRWVIARGVPKSGSLVAGCIGDLLLVQYESSKKQDVVGFLKQESLAERLWFFRRSVVVGYETGHFEVPKTSIYGKSKALVNACFHERAFNTGEAQPAGRTQEKRYSQASVVRLHAAIEQLLV